jgi:hypothetical protein
MLIPSYYDALDRQERSIRMRGDDPRHESMFSYVTPEKRVRADHPLRPIRQMAVHDASAPSIFRGPVVSNG